jgi:polysaccharide export outer membrane protein
MMRNKRHVVRVLAASSLLALSSTTVPASQSKPQAPPFEYRIGARDVLTVSLFGQDPKYSGDVTVQPDGKIMLLLVDEIGALGLTPMELKQELTRAYAKYFAEPIVMVRPKEFNSLKVFITGEVLQSGAYDLTESMNIVHLITLAGLRDWADKETIVLIRKDPLPDGRPDRVFFNLKALHDRKPVDDIPLLGPGDQVLVR